MNLSPFRDDTKICSVLTDSCQSIIADPGLTSWATIVPASGLDVIAQGRL